MNAAPRVMVVVARKHGATAEIADALARGLADSPAGAASGLSAVVVAAQRRPNPGPYDAVLLGSALYAGRWLDDARQFAALYADTLRNRRVWLFSSGPIGEPPYPADELHDAAPMAALTGALGHRVFPGRLDKSRLTFGERAMVTAMRAPVGDFRDWAEIAAWAGEIAAAVTTEVPAGRV